MKRVVVIGVLSTFLYAQVPTRENVAQLYVATFDRAPENAGLNYWLYNSGLSLEGIAKSFFDQKETKERYPSYLTTDKFIKAVYRNLFDRDPDDKGLEYWKYQIDNSIIPRDEFILATINGAKGDDKTILDNKMEVSLYFADSGLSDNRMAQFAIADVDSSAESVTSSKSMVDDFVSGRELVEYGRDRREDYFLYDINASDSDYLYKLDGCAFPDENTTFTYRVYSDYSASITYTDNGRDVTYPCVVKRKLERVKAVDGEVDAPFMKDKTALDGSEGIYYRLSSMYNGTILSIDNNGTRAYYVDSEGYHKYTDIIDTFKNIPLSHRGIKPILDDKKILEYGYMRASDRNYILDANGDLYIYKLGSCIYPKNGDTTYRFNIYSDYTASVSFTEDGKDINSICGVQNRYRKVSASDNSNLSAEIIDNPLYYQNSSHIYYDTIPVYRGTLIKIFNNGTLATIKDVPGYHFTGPIYSVFKLDPPPHRGRVNADNESLEDTGYMRVSDQNSLYNLRGENYAYKAVECDFPENSDDVYRFFAYRDGNVTIYNIDDDTVSNCSVKQKYQVITSSDKQENAKVYKDDFYYSKESDIYYRSVYKYKGVIVSILNDGQSAYIKDANGYYYTKPIYEVLQPVF